MHLLLFWKWLLVEPFHPLIPSLTNVSCPIPNTHPGNNDSFPGPQKTSEGGWMDPWVCFMKGGESQVGLGDTGQQLFLSCVPFWLGMVWEKKRECVAIGTQSNYKARVNVQLKPLAMLRMDGLMSPPPHWWDLKWKHIKTCKALSIIVQPHRTRNSPCSRELRYSGKRQKYYSCTLEWKRESRQSLSDGR